MISHNHCHFIDLSYGGTKINEATVLLEIL